MSDVHYVCVLDFEATCWENQPTKFHEIIEFPSVLLRWHIHSGVLEVVSEFRMFVKPRKYPTVSKFCFDLTHITQEMVDNGVPIEIALKSHTRWLDEHVPQGSGVTIVTCGSPDLQRFLPDDLAPLRIQPPQVYRCFVNLKDLFETVEQAGQAGPMTQMLAYYHMPPEGHLHSGIDDCRNIARIFRHLVENGLTFPVFLDNLLAVHRYEVKEKKKKKRA